MKVKLAIIINYNIFQKPRPKIEIAIFLPLPVSPSLY